MSFLSRGLIFLNRNHDCVIAAMHSKNKASHFCSSVSTCAITATIDDAGNCVA